jgi:hypothetical protein
MLTQNPFFLHLGLKVKGFKVVSQVSVLIVGFLLIVMQGGRGFPHSQGGWSALVYTLAVTHPNYLYKKIVSCYGIDDAV